MNMKRKIIGGIAMLAIAAIAMFNVNLNSKSNKLSDLALANVEALADGESNSGNCGFKIWSGDSYMIECGYSSEYVHERFNSHDTQYKWWCCDSCGSSTYCN
jgi:hypothetical protein